jgi:hypothetical protein
VVVISSDADLTRATVDRARGPEGLAMIAIIEMESTHHHHIICNAIENKAMQCGATRYEGFEHNALM